jgi:hypothetical protein
MLIDISFFYPDTGVIADLLNALALTFIRCGLSHAMFTVRAVKIYRDFKIAFSHHNFDHTRHIIRKYIAFVPNIDMRELLK